MLMKITRYGICNNLSRSFVPAVYNYKVNVQNTWSLSERPHLHFIVGRSRDKWMEGGGLITIHKVASCAQTKLLRRLPAHGGVPSHGPAGWPTVAANQKGTTPNLFSGSTVSYLHNRFRRLAKMKRGFLSTNSGKCSNPPRSLYVYYTDFCVRFRRF